MNKKITKFEFKDLMSDAAFMVKEEGNTPEKKEDEIKNDIEITEEFSDQNNMFEICHTVPQEKIAPKTITFTEEELSSLLEKTKNEAIESYVADVKVKNDIVEDEMATVRKLIEEIKTSIDLELNDLLDRILTLAHKIASKTIDVSLLHFSSNEFVVMLKERIEKLGFQSKLSLEIKNKDAADLLKQSGIEVSINDDMLPEDYKIIWCNGFLEKNTLNITKEIEAILENHKKKLS